MSLKDAVNDIVEQMEEDLTVMERDWGDCARDAVPLWKGLLRQLKTALKAAAGEATTGRGVLDPALADNPMMAEIHNRAKIESLKGGKWKDGTTVEAPPSPEQSGGAVLLKVNQVEASVPSKVECVDGPLENTMLDVDTKRMKLGYRGRFPDGGSPYVYFMGEDGKLHFDEQQTHNLAEVLKEQKGV